MYFIMPVASYVARRSEIVTVCDGKFNCHLVRLIIRELMRIYNETNIHSQGYVETVSFC